MHKRTCTVADWLANELDRTGAGVVEVAELGGIARQRVSEALRGEPVSRLTLGRIVAGLLVAERLRREHQPAPLFDLEAVSSNGHVDHELDGAPAFELEPAVSNGHGRRRLPQAVNAW